MGNGCCHITINSRFGNETKPSNPVLLYNANVFPSNVPKYANDHLQYNISGSCKHLTKNVIKLFSRQVSVHTNRSISWLPLLSQLPRPPPLCSRFPGGFIPQVGCPKGAQGMARQPATSPSSGHHPPVHSCSTEQPGEARRAGGHLRQSLWHRRAGNRPTQSPRGPWTPQTYTLLSLVSLILHGYTRLLGIVSYAKPCAYISIYCSLKRDEEASKIRRKTNYSKGSFVINSNWAACYHFI